MRKPYLLPELRACVVEHGEVEPGGLGGGGGSGGRQA